MAKQKQDQIKNYRGPMRAKPQAKDDKAVPVRAKPQDREDTADWMMGTGGAVTRGSQKTAPPFASHESKQESITAQDQGG